METRNRQIHIGTSGWSYDHWKGPFYPAKLANEEMLPFYTEHFRSTEINSTFYRLPGEQTLRHWYETTPADFLFAVKASRYITHMKKLREPRKTLPPFLDRIGMLGEKLGPILFQLPPRWRFNAGRLAAFLDELGDEFRYAFEFRDHSCLNPQVCKLLADRNAAFCIYELDGFMSPKEITADVIYVRLHGPAGPYQGSYNKRALSGWVDAFRAWRGEGREIFCYFDNDQYGHAVKNAASLQALI